VKYFPHGSVTSLNNHEHILTLAYQTNYNKVCLDTRLKLTGLFKLWIALHSSSHSVMSQRLRSSLSIFHRHVARAFAPEFPNLFSLRLSHFICTERWKTEVTCGLKTEVINKVDWLVIQFALFNFLNILTASNKLTQHPSASLVAENFQKQEFAKKHVCLVTGQSHEIIQLLELTSKSISVFGCWIPRQFNITSWKCSHFQCRQSTVDFQSRICKVGIVSLHLPTGHMEPFNDHASHYSGSDVFGYNSPPAAAREVFKPSTDAARLVGSINNFFLIWVRGSLGRGSQSRGVFDFLTNFDGPWKQIQWAKILAQIFFGNYMIPCADRAIAWPSSMFGTKIMARKPRFTPKIKKCMSLPLAATVACDNPR